MTSKEMKDQFENRIYSYVVRLIKFAKSLPLDQVTRVLVNQIVRSGSSVGANYFEARGASSKKDYQNYFSYSLKSANETRYWFRILKDSDLVPESIKEELIFLQSETDELANILAASLITMKKRS